MLCGNAFDSSVIKSIMLWKGDSTGFEQVCMTEQGTLIAGEKNYLVIVLYCSPLKQNERKASSVSSADKICFLEHDQVSTYIIYERQTKYRFPK